MRFCGGIQYSGFSNGVRYVLGWCCVFVTMLPDTIDDSSTSTRGLYFRPSQLCLLIRDSCCYHSLGSRHTTRPAHAGVGGHHTTVSPLFFIAYPQTRVPALSMLGPYAGTAGAGSNPLLDCSNPGLLKSTNPYPISRDLDPGMSSPSLTIPSSTSRRPRRDMPQLETKHNLKATIPSNSC